MRGLIESKELAMVAIDLGYNPGIADWLESERLPVVGVNFGNVSPNDKFENFGTYIWWLIQQAFMKEEIGIIDDPILVSQLSSRRVEVTPKGKLRLESKRKADHNSPDRADALALAWYARLLAVGADDYQMEAIENESSRVQGMIDQVSGDTSKKTIRNISLRGVAALDEEINDVGIGGGGTLESDELRL